MANKPIGPDGSYKTGQRVPSDGQWINTINQVITTFKGATFPPTVGNTGGQTTFWKVYKPTAMGM